VLLDLDLVVGKLLNSVRDRGFTSCQRKSSLSRVIARGRNQTAKFILLERQYRDQSSDAAGGRVLVRDGDGNRGFGRVSEDNSEGTSGAKARTLLQRFNDTTEVVPFPKPAEVEFYRSC